MYLSDCVNEAVEWAISKSLPTAQGQRNDAVLYFARHLAAIPALTGKGAEAMVPYLEQWFQRARPYIKSKLWKTTSDDFIRVWPPKLPIGQGLLDVLFKEATYENLPAAATRYEEAEVRRLVAFCRRLQLNAGDKPFFLGCRDAGRLIGLSHTEAAKLLKALTGDGVLALVNSGSQMKHQASEYRYLPPI